MKKMKMMSSSLLSQNMEAMELLFPSAFTEIIDSEGVTVRTLDFEKFRNEFIVDASEEIHEKYQLNWPGKRDSLVAANTAIHKTLRPSRNESVNFDTTKNLFIEGDNLEALKLLQEVYLNKVKLIYIDPPYNTGKDFVYKDSYQQTGENYLAASGQVDSVSGRMVANIESNGRFHSDWLSMMYSRLRLSRNILRDDGLIFVSIDDNEVTNLRKILDEIYGESNFVAQVVWEKMYTTKNDASLISQCHEYVLIYAKNIDTEPLSLLPRTAEMDARYTNPDNDPRGEWKAIPLYAKGETKKGRFPVMSPLTGKTHFPPPDSHWRFSESDVNEMIRENRISFGKDGESQPNIKRFLTDVLQGTKAKTLWKHTEVGSNDSAKRELKALYGEKAIPFDFPKPLSLMERIISLAVPQGGNHIVMDFFAGSGTTGHAVMLNQLQGVDCRFILVQLPQAIEKDKKEQAIAAEYCQKNSLPLTIAELSKDRLRLAGKQIAQQLSGAEVDVGFRVLKVDTSNLDEVYYNPDAVSQDLLSDQADNVKAGRTPEDLLFQVLLDWGVDLTLTIQKEAIHGKDVYFVDQNALAACFDSKGGVDEEFVKELAKKQPLRVVFRDAGFKSDSVKINVEQIFKLVSPSTEVKCI